MYIVKIIIFFILLVSTEPITASKKLIFINGLDDIPLHQNLKIVKDSLIIFDTNEGKYITTELTGEIKLTKVEEYYTKILPNLGWKIIEKNKYLRENKTLSIQFIQENEVLNVIFILIAN